MEADFCNDNGQHGCMIWYRGWLKGKVHYVTPGDFPMWLKVNNQSMNKKPTQKFNNIPIVQAIDEAEYLK